MKFSPKLGYLPAGSNVILESWCESDESWKRVESRGESLEKNSTTGGDPEAYTERIESLRRIINFREKNPKNSRSMEIHPSSRASVIFSRRSTSIFNFLLFLLFRIQHFHLFLNTSYTTRMSVQQDQITDVLRKQSVIEETCPTLTELGSILIENYLHVLFKDVLW